MNIVWTIDDTLRQTSDGLVTTAHWRVSAVDGEHSAGAYGSVGFTRGEDFTPYEQLTQKQVLGWCWKWGVGKDATEAALAANIEAQKHPTTATGVPW